MSVNKLESKCLPFMISAKPSYIAKQSDPENKKFVWAYEISIKNESNEIVQLLTRFWRITETSGRVEDIHGVGVIGLQPLLKPGKIFTYSSFCQLHSPQGTMEGYYGVQDLEENHFTIAIPKFILSAPSPITREFRIKLH